MAINKYKSIRGKQVNVSPYLYKAAEKNLIGFTTIVSSKDKRLDHYAHEFLGDANNWWVIAALSGIGWWLQVPNGVILRIPDNVEEIIKFIDELDI